MTKPTKRKPIRRRVAMTLTMEPDLAKRLQALATSLRRTRSAVAEDLLEAKMGEFELSAQVLNGPFLQAMYRALADPGVVKQLASAIGGEVSDDQMRLWQKELTALADSGSAVAANQHRAKKGAR